MWAMGWELFNGEEYPSVFKRGAHRLFPTFPDLEVFKHPKRDVKYVRVTIQPARRRLPQSSPNVADEPRPLK